MTLIKCMKKIVNLKRNDYLYIRLFFHFVNFYGLKMQIRQEVRLNIYPAFFVL